MSRPKLLSGREYVDDGSQGSTSRRSRKKKQEEEEVVALERRIRQLREMLYRAKADESRPR